MNFENSKSKVENISSARLLNNTTKMLTKDEIIKRDNILTNTYVQEDIDAFNNIEDQEEIEQNPYIDPFDSVTEERKNSEAISPEDLFQNVIIELTDTIQ